MGLPSGVTFIVKVNISRLLVGSLRYDPLLKAVLTFLLFTHPNKREGVQKKLSFWEISPKSVNPLTHPRVFVRSGKTKGEFRVKKGDFRGDLRGLDLVWESASPPTHIWERSPKKNVFLLLPFKRQFFLF